jgi:DNA polymerase I-like protein with 3'-5' exonuclease and polymerase domains
MWWARGYDPWPVLQVHDELVFEVEGEIAKEFCKSVQDELEGVCDLRVPVLCGSSISGESWGALK